MIKNLSLKILLISIFCLSVFFINAQQISSLKQVIASVDSFNSKFPAELLFLHFDKNNYSVGDTVWFKAYLLERPTHAYSAISGVLYVEVIDDKNKVVKRMSFPAGYGLSWGQIYLDNDDITEGDYTIRAYTNWMQNFGEDYFFQQKISVVNNKVGAHWLVKESHSIVAEGDKDNVDFTMQLNDEQNRPAKQKEFIVKVLNGKKVMYNDVRETNSVGILNGKFSKPANLSKDISILLVDKNDTAKKSFIPIIFNRPQNIDVQFMPESGFLVAGITSKVGFKSIGENGFGTEVQGKIIDSRNNEVASFKSIHKGMGFFKFTPVAGETYTAVINSAGTKQFSLPAVKNSGVVLELDNEQNVDSIKLTITCSPDLLNKQYYLLGLSRGVVCYGANITFRTDRINGMIAKSLFPTGVAHFTLMNMLQQPVNERILFIDHSDNLNINITSSGNIFSARDSIPLHITVTDKQGKPVTGSFSLSVTDDAQVKNDNNTGNIITKMMLTADLKGNIEESDYYTSNSDINASQALDALMLTQGWVGYAWVKTINPHVPLFSAEPQFSITGKVTNIFNSPINKAHVVLMSSGANLNVRDTFTNKNGEFIFTHFKKIDSLAFVIDARNAKDKKFGIGLTVNQFKPAAFTPSPESNLYPWYVNSDSTLINFTQKKQVIESQLNQSDKYKKLNEIKLNARKVVKGSSNLNGGGADQIIDEADIEKETGKGKNLLQLLKEKVKGFMELGMGDRYVYKINGSTVFFIVDGINLQKFSENPKDALEYLDAEDVSGIEVMYNNKYTNNYRSTFLTLGQLMDIRAQDAFIEITTRSGNGIFFKKSPGLVIYKPVPVMYPRQFYSPKYTVKNTTDKIRDLRATIYWQPSIITNKTGEANLYFYAADSPTTYSLNLQGSDLKGSVGYKIKKILIK